MPRHKIEPDFARTNTKRLKNLADLVEEEVRSRVGPNSTFEERQRMTAEVLGEVQWKNEDKDLRKLVSNGPAVTVDGKRYARLKQASSTIVFGRHGGHRIEEPLYREVGVHNGPTIRPLHLRAGIVENMAPDFACMVGELAAHHGSRVVDATLKATGFTPPSRAFLESHVHQMADEVFAHINEMEAAARTAVPLPLGVAKVSCGLDRMAIRMVEPSEEPVRKSHPRSRPYVRKVPPPAQYVYRMSRAASVTMYDAAGAALKTLYYSVDAGSLQEDLVRRVVNDVQWIVRSAALSRVECIQDAAPELLALPKLLRQDLPHDVKVVEVVDFEHTVGYLEDLVDAWLPAAKQDAAKQSYRTALLEDDRAIDVILQQIQAVEPKIPASSKYEKQRETIGNALSYIRQRTDMMRYATRRAEGFPIGSGATESTCGQMQNRAGGRGQSWESSGLRGILTLRSLVLSNRWDAAWSQHATLYLKEVAH